MGGIVKQKEGMEVLAEDGFVATADDDSPAITGAGGSSNSPEPDKQPKRNNQLVKRAFNKSDEDFLDLTLKFQQLIAQRDSAVAVRDKLEALCRELQRQNKLLMQQLQEQEDLLIPQSQIKLQPKRNNQLVKRAFNKSDEDFLDLTLKFQQLIAQRDSAVAVRDKLEALCRELQRQNKLLMDECKRVSTEGQSMRSDLSARFHDAIKDVSLKLEGQKDEYLTQLKENDMLRSKLKDFSDQYTVSEEQFTQKLKQKTLELQLAELRIQQHEEKLTHEQSQMKQYAEQVSQLLATEKTLRSQLASDGEKFQQFQDALTKSNKAFETFKQEIDKMGKSIKELKKENAFLKGKCEQSDVTLIQLVEEREKGKKQLEKLKNQKEKLESLCRSLQMQRKASIASDDTEGT